MTSCNNPYLIYITLFIIQKHTYRHALKLFPISLLRIYVSNLYVRSVEVRSACDLTNLFFPVHPTLEWYLTRPSLPVFLYILFFSESNSPVYSVGVMFAATVMIIIIYRVYSVICPHIIRVLKNIQYYIHNFCRRPTRVTCTP